MERFNLIKKALIKNVKVFKFLENTIHDLLMNLYFQHRFEINPFKHCDFKIHRRELYEKYNSQQIQNRNEL